MREKIITPIYYPLFKDAHNWSEPVVRDPWGKIGELPKEAKDICETLAMQTLLLKGTYYSDIKRRNSFFDFGNRSWQELSAEEKNSWGILRAESHNKLAAHEASWVENCEILKDYTHLLGLHHVLPVVTVTPFTQAYNNHINPIFKEAIIKMLEKATGEVHFIDFNESDYFDDMDFMDTDHLNLDGAMKFSYLLNEMFKVS